MKEFKVGLIGYGFSGAVFHAPVMSRVAGLKLTKIVSSDASKVHNDFPAVEVVQHSEDLINDPQLDVVVIASPNPTHFSLASQALQAGKHAVVEKPFVNRLEEGEQLIRLAKDNNRLLSVYHNRRWDGDFLTVRQLINDGILGNIHTFESHFDRYVPRISSAWREIDQPGSGTLYDLGSHLIDQVLVLFGIPDSIVADLDTQRHSASTVDYFHLLLNYRKTKVILHSSMLMHQRSPRFQVHGDKGSYIKYGYDPQEEMLIQGKKPGDDGWGKENPEFSGEIAQQIAGVSVKRKLQTLAGSYENYYKGLVMALQHGSSAPVCGEEALNTIKLIEAAIQSFKSGKTVMLQKE
jgi:scyllo-inositol 2-dehydrogenase (NADP+)